MQTLPKATGFVLDALTAGLRVGEGRKIDNSQGVYMAVHVERLGNQRYSVAHCYEQNGDLVPDPDGVFVRTDAGWLPVTLQLCTGHFTVAVELDDDERPIRLRPTALRELCSFAAMWLRNVAEQQFDPRVSPTITAK